MECCWFKNCSCQSKVDEFRISTIGILKWKSTLIVPTMLTWGWELALLSSSVRTRMLGVCGSVAGGVTRCTCRVGGGVAGEGDSRRGLECCLTRYAGWGTDSRLGEGVGDEHKDGPGSLHCRSITRGITTPISSPSVSFFILFCRISSLPRFGPMACGDACSTVKRSEK